MTNTYTQLLSTLHVFILLVFTIYAVFWLFAVELRWFSLETETYVILLVCVGIQLLFVRTVNSI